MTCACQCYKNEREIKLVPDTARPKQSVIPNYKLVI